MRGRQKMPSSTRWSPARSLLRTSVGSTGVIAAYSTSVRSNRDITPSLSGGLTIAPLTRANHYGFTTERT